MRETRMKYPEKNSLLSTNSYKMLSPSCVSLSLSPALSLTHTMHTPTIQVDPRANKREKHKPGHTGPKGTLGPLGVDPKNPTEFTQTLGAYQCTLSKNNMFVWKELCC